jgi:hypothetical protein
MNRIRALLAALLLCLAPWAQAQAPAGDEAIHDELRGLLRTVASAINERQYERLLPILSDSAHVVLINQDVIARKDQMQPYLDKWFGDGGYLKSLTVKLEADVLTELSPDRTWGMAYGTGVEDYRRGAEGSRWRLAHPRRARGHQLPRQPRAARRGRQHGTVAGTGWRGWVGGRRAADLARHAPEKIACVSIRFCLFGALPAFHKHRGSRCTNLRRKMICAPIQRPFTNIQNHGLPIHDSAARPVTAQWSHRAVGAARNGISADPSLPSWKVHVQTSHPHKGDRDEPQDHDRQHEGCGQHGACAQRRALVPSLLFPLIVMPLDGEEHARAEHENLERGEDYGDPIHRFISQPLFGTIQREEHQVSLVE